MILYSNMLCWILKFKYTQQLSGININISINVILVIANYLVGKVKNCLIKWVVFYWLL